MAVTGRGTPEDSLLDNAPCGFVAFADDGTVRVANATLLEMLGARREDVVGQHVERILTVGSKIFYQTHLFPLLRMHGHAEEIFLSLRSAGGAEVDALVNAVRRERAGEWVTDGVVIRVRERRKFEDALLRAKKEAEQARAVADARGAELEAVNTELEQQAMELELSQEELERQREIADEANEAKSAFLAAMSHELRTPLNAIGGYVQLLAMGIHGPVTAQQVESLHRVERSQRHLLRLINEVLNLARIESGRVHYDLQRVPVQGVVDTVVPMVEPQLAEHGLSLEVHVPSELVVQADRTKFEQIMLNLLGNAVKFTPRGGCVRVKAAPAAGSSKAFVLIAVEDTGIGIPTDQLPRLFEPFVQVDTSPSRRSEGTGLGLAISRDLARGMGGDLTARSVAGGGSTFTVELPAAE